jgi:hypothetical protein
MYNAALQADRSLGPQDVAVTTWMGYDRPMSLDQGPLGGATGKADDVVLRAHGIDMPAGGEAQITGMADQHAGAADGDDVVGVELVPTGGGSAQHGGPVPMPDHGVDGWVCDVRGALAGFERVKVRRPGPRRIGEVGVVEADRRS